MADLDLVALLNGHRGGFEKTLGLVFTRVSDDELACEVPVTPSLTQPYGIVHGGVYASMIETLASAGAAIHAMKHGRSTVGLENTTSFLHAVRGGTLTATATPLHRGRQTHVWQVEVRDDTGRLAATGRVRMICLEPGAQVAGEKLAVK